MSTTIEQQNPAQTRVEQAQRYVSPPVNVFEGKDAYTIQADLPGVSKQGLEITVEGNELTIIGRRNREQTGAEPLYRESLEADYQRAFELDPAVDATKIKATLEQGVLTVRLPKSERAKPKRITVTE